MERKITKVLKIVVFTKPRRNPSYSMYIQVQNGFTGAYNELRNEKSNSDYGKDFDKLNRKNKRQ